MNFEELPLELQYNILLNLSSLDLLNYCQTNRQAYAICQNDYFWILKLQQDFGIDYDQAYDLQNFGPRYAYDIIENSYNDDLENALKNGRLDYIYQRYGPDYIMFYCDMFFESKDPGYECAEYLIDTLYETFTQGHYDTLKDALLQADKWIGVSESDILEKVIQEEGPNSPNVQILQNMFNI